MVLLDRLKAEIAKNRPHMMKKQVILHQDNVPCHMSMETMTKMNELGLELLPHSPYFPELAPATTGSLQISNDAPGKAVCLK